MNGLLLQVRILSPRLKWTALAATNSATAWSRPAPLINHLYLQRRSPPRRSSPSLSVFAAVDAVLLLLLRFFFYFFFYYPGRSPPSACSVFFSSPSLAALIFFAKILTLSVMVVLKLGVSALPWSRLQTSGYDNYVLQILMLAYHKIKENAILYADIMY